MNIRILQTGKIFKRYGSFFLSLFLLTFSSSAFEERFQLATEKYKTREEGEVTRYSLVTERTRFFFQPPYKWKLSADVAHQTVIFLAADQSVAVKMQIGSNVSTENLAALRNEIQSRYPNGIIVAESTIYTAGGTAAPSFDIRWINSLKISVTARLVFVSTPNGTVEFSLATGSDKFITSSWAVNDLACSFRTASLHAKDLAKE